MSEILASWVNTDVGLSKKVQNFEQDFANGYLFGEILAKYKIQVDFHEFINKSTADAKILNFSKLSPSFALLNIKLDSLTANKLMTEQKGVAGRVLFQLKTALEQLGPKPGSPAVGQIKSTKSFLENTKVRSKPDTFEEMERSFYESRLKSISSLTEPAKRNALHLHKFENEHMRQEQRRREMDQADQTTYMDAVQTRRRGMLDKMRENREFLNQWDSASKERHTQTQMKARAREEADLRYELAVAEKKQRAHLIANLEATGDMRGGIDEFEKSLTRVADSTGGAPGGRPSSVPGLSATQHLMELKKRLPSEETMQAQAEHYLQRVKAKKEEETNARKEREKRRRKALVDQQRMYSEVEAKHAEELLLERLMKQCEDEREMAKSIEETRRWREVIRENRMLREKQYEEQRQKDFELAMQREAEIQRRLNEEYERQTAVEKQRYLELEAEKKRLKHERNVEICEDITRSFFDVVFKAVDYRTEHRVEHVPQKEWTEWLTLFSRGLPLDGSMPANATNGDVALNLTITTQATAATDQSGPVPGVTFTGVDGGGAEPGVPDALGVNDPVSALLEEVEYEEYSAQTGEWAPEPSDEAAPPHNPRLASALKEIEHIAYPPLPTPRPPPTPIQCVRAVFLGKPLSGKTVLARTMALKYGSTYVVPSEVVSHAISSMSEAAPEGEPQALAELRATRKLLAQQAKSVLATGREVPDEIVVGLVVNHLSAINAAEGKEKGWVIDGFPSTTRAAQILEKELSGYVDKEAPVPPGKKTKLVKTPEEAPPPATAPKSGIDAIIHIDIDNDTVFARAAGQKFNPSTTEIYHLVYNPPPKNVDLMALVPIDEVHPHKAQLNAALLAAEEEHQRLAQWLAKFSTLTSIDGKTAAFEEVTKSVDSVLEAVVAKKEQEEKEKQAQQQTVQEPATSPEPGEPVSSTPAAPPAEPTAQPTATAPATAVVPPISGTEEEGATPGTPLIVLDESRAQQILEQWSSLEGTYLSNIKGTLRALRRQFKHTSRHYMGAKSDFLAFVRTPDETTQVIEEFQQEFNAVFPDLRMLADTKARLTQRATELRDKLWEICDATKSKAEERRSQFMSTDQTEFVSAQILEIKKMYMQLVVAEASKFQRAKKVLIEYYAAKEGKNLDQQPAFELIDVSYREPKSAVPATKGKTSTLAAQPAGKLAPQKSARDLKASAAAQPPPAAEVEDELLLAVEKSKALLTLPIFHAPPPVLPTNPKDKAAVAAAAAANAAAEASKLVPSEDLQSAVEEEGRVMMHRIQCLVSKANAHVKHLESNAQQVYEKMDTWLGIHYRAQMDCVKEVLRKIVGCIQRGEPLLYNLKWSGEDFVVDEEQFLTQVDTLPNSKEHSDQSLLSKTNFSVSQVMNLIDRFKYVAPSGFIAKKEFMLLFLRLISSSVDLPTPWLSVSQSTLERIFDAFAFVLQPRPRQPEISISAPDLSAAVATVAAAAAIPLSRPPSAKSQPVTRPPSVNTSKPSKTATAEPSRPPSPRPPLPESDDADKSLLVMPWRRFVLSLVLSPQLFATPEDIASLKAQLTAAAMQSGSKDQVRWPQYVQVSPWFEHLAVPEIDEDEQERSEDSQAVPGTPAVNPLKAILFYLFKDLFKPPPPPEQDPKKKPPSKPKNAKEAQLLAEQAAKEAAELAALQAPPPNEFNDVDTISTTELLLQLCVDDNAERAVRKACVALAEEQSEQPSGLLTKGMLLKILQHNTSAAGAEPSQELAASVDALFAEFSVEEEVPIEQGSSPDESSGDGSTATRKIVHTIEYLTFDQIVSSPLGKALIDKCTGYQLKTLNQLLRPSSSK